MEVFKKIENNNISKNIVKENNINDYIINEDFIVTKIN